MGRRIVSGGCHLVERKNGDFEVTTRLLADHPLLDDGFPSPSSLARATPRLSFRPACNLFIMS
ncbi:unnamed protein product [Spirodela intermedia]|uniref:Uncharacterized protein n=1 Tax=Spirodela intermedia TaxID=51605 RepID=A0ABN7E9I9_SPIIN|nr:unnamed protein product [Spirodela intermedia]